MPQENYNLIEFNWDESLENLRKSSLVVGDFGGEEISRTRGVAYANIKVKDEKVSFGLSQYGKLQISSPNAELLRRAKSQLNKLMVCSRWVPSEEEKVETEVRKYRSIMDLPEAKEADWSRIPKEEILLINKLWSAFSRHGFDWPLDIVRSKLASYAKNDDNIKSKSLKEKSKEWFGVRIKK